MALEAQIMHLSAVAASLKIEQSFHNCSFPAMADGAHSTAHEKAGTGNLSSGKMFFRMFYISIPARTLDFIQRSDSRIRKHV